MTWKIEIENIAGIYEGSAELEPGLNAVKGSNWQGKSSFIEAIKTGLGTAATLTEGKDHGSVYLQTPEKTVSVDLSRSNGVVDVDGTPYLETEYDIARTSLFACLGEQNEIRRAVREGKNLEEVLLRPLDFQNIDVQIADLKSEREGIDSELAQAKEARKRLPGLQERVTQLETEIEDLHDRREEFSNASGSEEQSTSVQSELSQAQANRSQAKSQLERLDQTIERVENRLEDRRSELESIDIDEDDTVESELEDAREKRQEVNRALEMLQNVYSANELVLEEDHLDLITTVNRELSGDSVVCWTCDSTVSRSDLENRLDALGEKITEKRAQLKTRRDQVEKLEARREERAQARRRKRDLEGEIEDLEEKLADRKQSLEEARDRFESADERVETLSEMVDETVDAIADVESEIKYRKAELKDARTELDELESRADQIETLEAEREEIQREIEELRNRKQEIKQQARDEFSDSIREISERFETGFESAHLTGGFDLVVAREGREANLEALSEGELELIGFIAALAGYESFDVDEAVPILLVDGVGSLADENLQTLVEYLDKRTEYLVFTTYPEHTTSDGRTIDPTSWSVASRDAIDAD
ncbi:archaea-specific SMC-related protein [Natrinema halophilum]|uniref:archaea-specific SMC-related protein n=1 Tax=Natrinema halophilum TaxID=1699371 RepID=UPI001F44FC3D|nr:archaea-specific SMC-related protein [Natrinema halophilum]UHQ96159.1 ATPase [Natrinema halophilum]